MLEGPKSTESRPMALDLRCQISRALPEVGFFCTKSTSFDQGLDILAIVYQVLQGYSTLSDDKQHRSLQYHDINRHNRVDRYLVRPFR